VRLSLPNTQLQQRRRLARAVLCTDRDRRLRLLQALVRFAAVKHSPLPQLKENAYPVPISPTAGANPRARSLTADLPHDSTEPTTREASEFGAGIPDSQGPICRDAPQLRLIQGSSGDEIARRRELQAVGAAARSRRDCATNIRAAQAQEHLGVEQTHGAFRASGRERATKTRAKPQATAIAAMATRRRRIQRGGPASAISAMSVASESFIKSEQRPAQISSQQDGAPST